MDLPTQGFLLLQVCFVGYNFVQTFYHNNTYMCVSGIKELFFKSYISHKICLIPNAKEHIKPLHKATGAYFLGLQTL